LAPAELEQYLPRFAWLKAIMPQALQKVTCRIEKGYQLFFRNLKAGVKTAPQDSVLINSKAISAKSKTLSVHYTEYVVKKDR
jgi:hypothetical protein